MFKIGHIWGVPIRIHWSFSILFVIISYLAYIRNLDWIQISTFLLLLVLLFASVLLHELGHALTARRMGIKATDIILSPIGGLARLESLYKYPEKEIKVALAGPVVNFLIALVLFVYLYYIAEPGISFDPYSAFEFISLTAIMYFILYINVLLFVLNLVPAFPMDGGRVLRALLSFKLGPLKATQIASFTGRIISIVFLVVAVILRNYALIIISLFVYVLAVAEYRSLKSNLENEEIKKAGPSFPPTNRPEEDLNT